MNGYGKATQIGTGTSSGQYLGLGWDGLGRVKSLATIGLAQSYTYAPSGLRIRVLDTATPANNRRYAYTSGGLLMSEFADGAGSLWKRDVVYLGSEPVAEIDAAGIHELHNDHLGTPRIITKGADGTIEGKQAFGPYGEVLSGQAAGYKPLTGYTGHLQSEPSGLVYMRGRFYSPAWHRFVNSDQGVDPNSWNQMAYVGGSPFMAVDPSGMIYQVPENDIRFWQSFYAMKDRASFSNSFPKPNYAPSGGNYTSPWADIYSLFSSGFDYISLMLLSGDSLTGTIDAYLPSTGNLFDPNTGQTIREVPIVGATSTAKTSPLAITFGSVAVTNNGSTNTIIWGDNLIVSTPLKTTINLNNKNANLLSQAGQALTLAAGAYYGPLALIPGIPTIQLGVANANGQGINITFSTFASPFYPMLLPTPFWASSR